MSVRRLRVLVVEDSLTVRKRICEVLQADPDLAVVGEAEDGKSAIELCAALRPDVITMDMMMPVMTGLAAVEHIMAHNPTPILIVSASTNRGELFRTYEALAAGAVDVLEKPLGDEDSPAWERRLCSTVKLVARIKVITHPRARLRGLGHSDVEALAHPPALPPSRSYRAIALGASTGGPGAVVEILRALPRGFPIPVLLVLHITEPFGSAFADWLDGVVDVPVAFARGGETLADCAGRVVMAPPDRHLVLLDGRLRLDGGPERYSCRPSVDVLFESLATDLGPAGAACILTGMGRDGAAGLLQVKQRGGMTFAQDEASCVVYGMPREAVLLGAAAHVLALGQIGPALCALAGKGSGVTA